MSQPTILRVARRGDRWNYFLFPPGDLLLRVAPPPFEAQIDPDLLRLLCGQIESAVRSSNASPARNARREKQLIQVGRALFTALFPDEASGLRDHLRNLTTPLLVVSDDRDVPWESLFVLDSDDPDGFLGLRVDIGRGLVSTSVPNLPVVRPHTRRRCLIVANPTGDLEENEAEAAQLERWFSQRGFDCRLLSGANATMEGVVTALLEAWDVIHFSCHVEPENSSLVLHDGMLTPRAIQPLLRGAPIAFVNGCESASVEMLTEAFLRGGAQAVIGSLYEMPPAGAAAFSLRFYEGFLAGQKLGEAVRAARRCICESGESGSWAAFVLFGDPCLKPQVDRDPLEDALRRVGIGPSSFDCDAAMVIREAYRFGHPVGAITSACIFAGLLAVRDPLLVDRLAYFRIPADALDRAFRETFTVTAKEEGAEVESGERAPEFSENAATWLRTALEASGPEITRAGLYRGWVQSGGGGAGRILRQLGMPLESLDPDLPFPPSVEKVGRLRRSDCAPEGWNVLEKAAELAAGSGASGISSVHLAAALQMQPGGLLATALNQAGASIDLRTWLRRGDARLTLASDVHCSETVDLALDFASRKACELQRSVAADDLAEALLQSGGGATGRALDERGVWRKLVDALPRHPGMLRSVGPIGRDGSTDECWAALAYAAEFAAGAGRAVVSTFDLLAGLQVDPGGILARRLAALKVRIQLRSWVQPVGPSRVFVGAAPCSENSNRILLLAQASAAASSRAIAEADLLQSFVASGGGHAGKRFDEICCPLPVLVSELFLAGGAVDLDRFDDDARNILQRAVDFASEKRWPMVTRDHLVYALMAHCRYFAARLRADDLSPEQMADLAFSYLSTPPAGSELRLLSVDLRSFGGDLVRVLCAAGDHALPDRLIGEQELATAWAGSGGGAFGQVLIQHNFHLRRLLDETS